MLSIDVIVSFTKDLGISSKASNNSEHFPVANSASNSDESISNPISFKLSKMRSIRLFFSDIFLNSTNIGKVDAFLSSILVMYLINIDLPCPAVP